MKKSGIIVIGIVFVLLLAAALVGVFTKTVSDVAGKGYVLVSKQGEVITSGQSLGRVLSGESFSITSSGAFNVRIEAYSDERNDFYFNVAGEGGYKWSQLNGRDMTSTFIIEESKDGVGGYRYMLRYSDMNEMLTTIYQDPVTGAAENLPKGDIFRIVFEGVNSVTATFSISVGVTGIVLQENIVF